VSKKQQRLRRAKKSRGRIKRLGVDRLSVHRTPRHFYAQIFAPCGSKVLVSASTIDKEIKSRIKCGGNIEAAAAVGKTLAERAQKANISNVAFDRSGFKFHGRVKAFADSAREQGMKF